MTDIDFDELDKAVNSALKPALEAHDAEQNASLETPADAPSDTSKPDEPSEHRSSGPAVIIKSRNSAPLVGARDRQDTSTSPAIKRSGRFMDMVHPSSDMASEKKAAPAPKVKIMPTENAPKPEEKSTPEEKEEHAADTSAFEPAETPQAPEPYEPKNHEAPAPDDTHSEPEETPEELVKSDYPDPIDVAGPLSIAEEPTPEASEPAADNKPEPSPAEVPFLPDAKVEKRPLGGFSPDEMPEEPEAKPEADESQLPPEAGLPAALQSDVVAVESDVLPDMLPGQADEEFNDSDKQDKPSKESHAAKPAATANEGTPQSIPQQYHSAPATADEDPRPVFDTDQYHQPLLPAHSGKKSHVWTFILLILALLAVGGTLGYFAFMSGL